MPQDKKIVVYVARDCGPCEQVSRLVQEGKAAEEVDLVDIETDEGFARFSTEVLSQGESGVPCAFSGPKECEILYDDEKDVLYFDCTPKDAPPASPSETPSPPPDAAGSGGA